MLQPKNSTVRYIISKNSVWVCIPGYKYNKVHSIDFESKKVDILMTAEWGNVLSYTHMKYCTLVEMYILYVGSIYT